MSDNIRELAMRILMDIDPKEYSHVEDGDCGVFDASDIVSIVRAAMREGISLYKEGRIHEQDL